MPGHILPQILSHQRSHKYNAENELDTQYIPFNVTTHNEDIIPQN